MKILVVGGTGGLGGHVAAQLAGKGHDVTIAARKPALPETPMAKLPLLQGDYVAGDFTVEKLRGFEGIIFAAGNDPRHIPDSTDAQAHLDKANVEAIPAFARVAREAGVKRFVQLGSYYSQAAPELEKNNGYIRSRRLACEGARAESRPGFDVMSVNAPIIVGWVHGLPSPMFQTYIDWAKGKLPIPRFGPAGGSNFLSIQALSDAMEGALFRGEGGKAYLVGDLTMSFADYFDMFFKAAGSPHSIEERDAEHPLIPDAAIPQGRGNWIRYEPDAQEMALLGYSRGGVPAAVAAIFEQYSDKN